MNNKNILIYGLTFLANTAMATEIIYKPVNPSFGGSPLNGNYLLSNASAQDDNEKPGSRGSADLRAQRSDLDQFNDLLQRSILNRIASTVTGSLVNTNGNLIPGTVQTADFTITIVDLGGGILEITTIDITTGQSTVFQVSGGA
jgi:curli production assembly/transport component CsgF